MTVIAITSANVGTKLATLSDTKITGLTVATPTAGFDAKTPLALVDAAAAPTATSLPPHALYLADMATIGAQAFAYKPGPSAPPGVTAPVSPWNLGGGGNFTNGVFVQSCPAGVTFSLTTG
jgi:hypothetical protein